MAQRRVEAMDVFQTAGDRALGEAGHDIADNEQDDGADGGE
ncbi:hypothetical protein MEA186_32992 [Mesorhizobium amorphae CCNWGS0123]|uniref:Uncharacterized protein n=1 Tax=Mesorhizobium amorphae CCNWGS0123 TaxID=1082933 RepID=G6YKR3_9HYPH|nr:hypothetical protein [Mesorhizobium amorphae]EHH03519.1 hypothetical protein MEA186_32992 [Mesorhizobium amorphae CCNWGS0123]